MNIKGVEKDSLSRLVLLLLGFQLLITGCVGATTSDKINSVIPIPDNKPIVDGTAIPEKFSKGADVSWLPEMEKSGFKFFNALGEEEDCLKILKEHGMNTIRLRTWVNPSDDKVNGHCSTEETVTMALRAKKMGFKIMIDFHYSDSWADPGKQVKPKAWEKHTFNELLTDIYDYTYYVMQELKNVGIYPEWVQVGNEINPGMVLPNGSSDDMPKLSKMINKGYDAVKAISPESKVIIHLANGTDNGLYRWFFDGIKKYSAKYDIIGLSYYPFWDKKSYKENIGDLESNMKDMVSRYGKDVMVVETGGADNQPEDTYEMVSAVIEKLRAIPDGKGVGVLYWEPEGAFVWSGYSLSCWGSDGKPTKALDAFLK